MTKTLPIIALVGPPNAGKSTLVNKIAGVQTAITSAEAGTTRDRQYLETSWNGKSFLLVDTAGLSVSTHGELEASLLQQTDIALKQASVIVLVVDGKQGRLSIDRPILQKFRKSKKPILLVVNKLDSIAKSHEQLADFAKLGIKTMIGVSSLTGRGIGDLLDNITEKIPKFTQSKESSDSSKQSIAISIVGKPNVGKSSIFNAIVKEDRVVVSPIAGTTRTAIDSQVTIEGQNYTFIDTAGLKKKEHRQAQADVFAGFQTFRSIRRADVCFLVVDATQTITKQDQRVAQEIFAMEKGCVILANKFDLYSGDEEKLQDYISLHFPFLWMCPVFFVSGKTGEGLLEAIAAVAPIYERRLKEIDSQVLTDFLAKKMEKNPPRLLRDQKKPKVISLKQYETNPPGFELLVNHPAAISLQFRKFLENGIIRDLDFWGTPITLRLKGKDKT